MHNSRHTKDGINRSIKSWSENYSTKSAAFILSIQAHVGTHENKMADRYEKKGRKKYNNNMHVYLRKDDMKLAFRNKITEEWTLMYKQSLKGRHAYILLNALTRECLNIN